MPSVKDDFTPAQEAGTISSDPFAIDDMHTASEAFKATADASPDCRLQPTAAPDESASDVREGTDQLPGSTAPSEVVQGLEAAAEYVRTTDGRQMLATLQTFIKNNPGVSVTVAAAFGFVVGRSIRRD